MPKKATKSVFVRPETLVVVVVVVTLFIQGGPFSYEAGIQRGPVSIKLITCYISTIIKIT